MTNQTSSDTRRRVLSAVDSALREHYGENYSMRCAQASQAIAELLRRCGVPAWPIQGQACVTQVIGGHITWLCFGGSDAINNGQAHCWVLTNCELIDLTIWQHYLVPGADPGGVPSPALWLNEGMPPPPTNIYLPGEPRGAISVSFADQDEDAQFRRFLEAVHRYFDCFHDEGLTLSFDVLSSAEDLKRLQQEGNPWLSAVWAVSLPPPPSWVQRRQYELRSRQ